MSKLLAAEGYYLDEVMYFTEEFPFTPLLKKDLLCYFLAKSMYMQLMNSRFVQRPRALLIRTSPSEVGKFLACLREQGIDEYEAAWFALGVAGKRYVIHAEFHSHRMDQERFRAERAERAERSAKLSKRE